MVVPGATFRRHLCAGKPLEPSERWYAGSRITALNMLVGFRVSSCVWDHLKGSQAGSKNSLQDVLATPIVNGGQAYAPYLDRRTAPNQRRSAKEWAVSAIDYIRADGRHIKLRMHPLKRLTEEW